jgi:CheY-like chemotaxis protein
LAQNSWADTTPSENPESLTKRLEGIDVLVVEDETDTRELIAEAIRQHGGRTKTADSYEAALAALKDFTPDILLVDIGMPTHDGYALIKMVRSLAHLKRTPAIAVTAYAGESDRHTALEAGFQAHVSKPFDPVTLVDQITDLIYQHQA